MSNRSHSDPRRMRRTPAGHMVSGTQAVPALARDVLNAPGKPLDAATRARMEPRFGADFSMVRIHSDGRAAASARVLGARAYTSGSDIVFGAGQFAPHTGHGQRLLAHELAHVLQPLAPGAEIGRPGDASEREAEAAASAVAAGAQARVGAAARAALQLQPAPEDALNFEPLPPLTGSKSLLDKASPFLAAAVGSATLDGFDVGKSELKPDHLRQLAATAANIRELLNQYPLSTVRVTGHADTLGTEPRNLTLGMARAAVVKQALVDLGVAGAIISIDSKGESAPQAVATRDETPNAGNRRVEVRFHPRKSGLRLPSPQSTLKPPTALDPQGAGDRSAKRPIDLFPPLVSYVFGQEPRPPFRALQPDYFKSIPPPPKGSEWPSALDVIGKKIIDPVVDAVAGFLPKDARDKIKDAARGGVKSGIAKGVRAVAEAQGVTDGQALDAIEKATEAAIQEKGQERQ